MEKKTPLLDEIGRKHGMKVPGNYFADFTEKMAYDENVYGNILGGKRRNS